MSRFRLTLHALTFLVFTFAFTAFAQAQATRTWVSGVGDDVNPCSRTAPCKTFAGAISKTAAGGEIDALDPGGYGTVTITKSITIDGTGTNASILASGTNGVIVNDSATAAPNTIVVVLRNLSINGAGTTLGIDGIRYLSGARLNVEKCQISNFSGDGIEANKTNVGRLSITDTDIRNVGTGLRLTTSSSELLTTVSNTQINNTTGTAAGTGVGVEAISNVRLGMQNVVVSHCITGSATGVRTSGSNSIINADDLFVTVASTGVQASAGSTVRLSDGVITQNGTGISANGGTLVSLQGNSVFGNTVSDGTPFPSTINKQ